MGRSVQHHVEERGVVGSSRGVVEEAEEEDRVEEDGRQREHGRANGAINAASADAINFCYRWLYFCFISASI